MAELEYRSISLPNVVVDRIERIRKQLPQLGLRSNAALIVRAIDEYLTGLEVKYGLASVTPRASKAAVEA